MYVFQDKYTELLLSHLVLRSQHTTIKTWVLISKPKLEFYTKTLSSLPP